MEVFHLHRTRGTKEGGRIRRSKNFTDWEKNYLVEIASQYTILENKKTDTVTVLAKKEAWAEITSKYNSSCQTGSRTPKQLHGLYDFLRKKMKKANSNDHVQIYKTSGGTFPENDDLKGIRVIEVVSGKIDSLKSTYDSSTHYESDGNFIHLREESEVLNSQAIEETTSFIPETIAIDDRETSLEPETSVRDESNNSHSSVSCTPSIREARIISNGSPSVTLPKSSVTDDPAIIVCAGKSSSDDYSRIIHEKKCKILDLELEAKHLEIRTKHEILDRLAIEKKIKEVELEIMLKKLKKEDW